MNMRVIVRIISPRRYSGVLMPAASFVHDHLVGMVSRGWAGLVWSAVGLLAAVDVGLNEGRSRGTADGNCLPDRGGAGRASWKSFLAATSLSLETWRCSRPRKSSSTNER